MADWPKYNPERHAYFAPAGKKRVPYCPITRGGCGQPCSTRRPCHCCETARADEAEQTLDRVREVCRDYEAVIAAGLASRPGEVFSVPLAPTVTRLHLALDGPQ